jgi:ribose transport system substrate-binding protein
MAGEQLGKLLHGKGKVVLFRFKQGSASTSQRQTGFLEAIKKFPDIQVIVDDSPSSSGNASNCIRSVEVRISRRGIVLQGSENDHFHGDNTCLKWFFAAPSLAFSRS